MWKVVINSNLNSPLKLFFFSPILTNNNLLLKIYCENIVVKFLNQDFLFFILFFILSFHSPPHTCPLSPFFYFFLSFSPPEPSSNISFAPLFLKKKKKIALLIGEKRETETETKREEKDWERSAWPPPHASPLPLQHLHRQAGSDRLVFFCFFFSYLLVLIQIYFKNWILFCGLCLDQFFCS